MINAGPSLSEFDRKLMAEAVARRDAMVANGDVCCINCEYGRVIPALASAASANYLKCSFEPVPFWAEIFSTRIVSHMSGTNCKTFRLRPKR